MMMKTNRRTFLRAAGISLGLPMLESFGASSGQPSPRRMIAINQDLGFIPKLFFPKGEGRNYELSSYLEKIADHRDKFTVFSGLSHPGVAGGQVISHRGSSSWPSQFSKYHFTRPTHCQRDRARNQISLLFSLYQ